MSRRSIAFAFGVHAIGEYRCGPRETWDEVVAARALAIAEEVRAAYPDASHAYTDAEALDTA
jgi:hypothetical protein